MSNLLGYSKVCRENPGSLEKAGFAVSNRRAVWLITLVIGVLTANWLWAVGRFQVNIPAWDQWDFFSPFFEGENLWALFSYQHGPHRQGLGVIFTAGVMKLSHWDSRWESVWIVGVILFSAILALRVKCQLCGPLRVRDAWVPLLVMTLSQYQTVIMTPNSSHSVFPLMLILLATNIWLAASPIRYAFAGACVGCLAFTGFGIFGGALFTLLLLGTVARAGLNRRWSDFGWAAAGTIIAGIAWFAFFYDYTFQPAAGGFRFPWSPLSDYARFLSLMLAYPAGLQGATAWNYAAGGVALLLAAALLTYCAWRWLAREGSPADDVLFALIGAGVLFAANTAVGRVQLGVEAGMTSRYVTLLTPIWLALGFWAARRGSWTHIGMASLLWSISLWPYHELVTRRFGNWGGTAGITDLQLRELEECTEERLQAAETFLGNPHIADDASAVLSALHPAPATTHLVRKLEWLRSHRLSLFASTSKPDYLPWIAHDSASWHGVQSELAEFRWMEKEATLITRSAHPAFVNFRVLGHMPDLPTDGGLAFIAEDRPGNIPADEQQVISLPVQNGTRTITFQSVAGTRPVHEGNDHRNLSFRFSLPWLSAEPAGIRWKVDPAIRQWRPLSQLEILSGGYGWEPNGLQWTDAHLSLKARTTEPAFLNIFVADRYNDVPSQPIQLSCDGQRYTVPLHRRQASFSVPLRTTKKNITIELEDLAGALRPSDKGPSTDHRELAMRLSRLSIDAQPAYQLLEKP